MHPDSAFILDVANATDEARGFQALQKRADGAEGRSERLPDLLHVPRRFFPQNQKAQELGERDPQRLQRFHVQSRNAVHGGVESKTELVL